MAPDAEQLETAAATGLLDARRKHMLLRCKDGFVSSGIKLTLQIRQLQVIEMSIVEVDIWSAKKKIHEE